MRLYGIPNCNTVKKARAWLDTRRIAYEFHDYKKSGVPEAQLRAWIKRLGWETLVNHQGTTWRQLSDAEKATVKDADSALALMLAKPSVIKRPVVEAGKTLLVGFDEARYEEAFKP